MTFKEFISLPLSKMLWHLYAAISGVSAGGGGGGTGSGNKLLNLVPIVADSDVTVPVTATSYSFVITDGEATVGGVPLLVNIPVTGTGPLSETITVNGGAGAVGLLAYETIA